MSKTRVPRLPAGSNRATIQSYVKDVRRYAQAEFQRGATEQEIYTSVNQAGVTLPALRSVIRREYLVFIGVSDSTVKGIRFFAMLCAMAFYAVLSSHIISDLPVYRYALPAFIAVALFMGVESLAIKVLKRLKKPKPV